MHFCIPENIFICVRECHCMSWVSHLIMTTNKCRLKFLTIYKEYILTECAQYESYCNAEVASSSTNSTISHLEPK